MSTEPTVTFTCSIKLSVLQKIEAARGETPRSKFISDTMLEKLEAVN